MSQKLIRFSHRYELALGSHLRKDHPANLQSALALGRQAVALGVETLELARIHERAIASLRRSGSLVGGARRGEIFFREANTPIVETHRAALQSKTDLNRLNMTLTLRAKELTATNLLLKRGIQRRKGVEAALKKSGEHCTKLLKESLQLQEGFRQLTHKVLSAQEEERKKISLELQDEVAQTLLGINVRLHTLKKGALINNKGLNEEIASTRRLVASSARSVRRVAREICPISKRNSTLPDASQSP